MDVDGVRSKRFVAIANTALSI